MVELLTKLGLCVSLKELGIEEGEITAMIEKISGNIRVDSLGREDGICRMIYEVAM